MTQPEALVEARRRWGIYAKIRRYGKESACHHAEYHVTQLYPENGMISLGVFGCGDSWEAAFADADTKENLK